MGLCKRNINYLIGGYNNFLVALIFSLIDIIPVGSKKDIFPISFHIDDWF